MFSNHHMPDGINKIHVKKISTVTQSYSADLPILSVFKVILNLRNKYVGSGSNTVLNRYSCDKTNLCGIYQIFLVLQTE